MTGGKQEELRARLFALGFDDVRFAATTPLPRAGPLRDWLSDGMHADMAWMERTAEKRLEPERVLTGVKSVIMLGVSYSADRPDSGARADGRGPIWARYALREDYHDTIKPALVAAGRAIEELFGAVGSDYRYYVDTGPVLERSWAERAGIGFIGKNSMLISRRHGNWLFLAAVLTRLEFLPDEPVRKKIAREAPEAENKIGLLCGKCTRCLDACPTQAFPRPGVVDSRRCISYQTIENKGIIPRELRQGIGARIYGCDVCLEVCPWNRLARQGRELLLIAKHELAGLTVRDILELTPARFAELFRRTAIKRVKLSGLLRNACVVAGNSGDTTLLPVLIHLASHESAIVRAHAVWAVFQLAGQQRAEVLLKNLRAAETDISVLDEYETSTRLRP